MKLTVMQGMWSLAVLLGVAAAAHAQMSLGNGFLYSRSNMKVNGTTVHGKHDFRFRLFTAVTGGVQIGPTIDLMDISASNGKLPAQILNFGPGAFNGDARFIEVRARKDGGGFLLVGARQRIRPEPYALALPGLYTITNDICPNVVGGISQNIVGEDVVGATISGGGSFDEFDHRQHITASYSTIGGGMNNAAHGMMSTVGGGSHNEVSGAAATISGGNSNVASAGGAAICGGGGNLASGLYAIVGGGGGGTFDRNQATGERSAVLGGLTNLASGNYAAVGGGSTNSATGLGATIPGGLQNTAAGIYSFAAGRRAKANHNGAFVWGDSTDSDIGSFASNSVTMRAVNGFVFYTNSALTSGAAMGAGAGSWTSLSDRNRKTDIEPINAREILERVASLPITSWRYDSQPESIRHIGPMAQDFNPAFGVGEFENGITTVDIDGVALAAIQGLHQIMQEKDARIQALEQTNAELNARLERLEAKLAEK